MAKLTKRQTAALHRALHHLDRVQQFIARPDVAVARKGGPATTTLHYTRSDGATLYEIDKTIGSDLTGIEMSAQELRAMISENA